MPVYCAMSVRSRFPDHCTTASVIIISGFWDAKPEKFLIYLPTLVAMKLSVYG